MNAITFYPDTIDRMFQAVENVRIQRDRAIKALNPTGIPHALIGGQAVAYWVRTKDDGADRSTPNSDFLIRDADFDTARTALESVGFVHRPEFFRGAFTDGPEGKARNGVRLWIAGERVRPDDLFPLPDVSERIMGTEFPVVSFEAQIRTNLDRNRNVDGMYLRDMLGVGLFDWSWPERFPPILADRLRHVLNTPDG